MWFIGSFISLAYYFFGFTIIMYSTAFLIVFLFDLPGLHGLSPRIYGDIECQLYWKETISTLLESVHSSIPRSLFSSFNLTRIGHTPLWLRISDNKLHCVRHPKFTRSNFRMKIYRALHYINRINRILQSRKIANNTEWLSHFSDSTKLLKSCQWPVPAFSISGNKDFYDIPGIPFMSFSDKLSKLESIAITTYNIDENFENLWSRKSNIAFFRGSLSDCNLHSNQSFGINSCARAKLVFEAGTKKNLILSGVSTTSDLHQEKFLKLFSGQKCHNCQSKSLNSASFVKELIRHKYVLSLPGAGNWSRRLGTLLQSGSTIFQAENPGFQFYEAALKPGVHYIPFDAEVGEIGLKNLLSRLDWARMNDLLVKSIARRSETFGRNCLKESSIDFFVFEILSEYSKYLIGPTENLPTVDLSSCVQSRDRHSVSKLCKDIVSECWN